MTDLTANKVYKVLTLGEWEEASKIGQIVTALDQQDGFVHLSSATQLNMTCLCIS